MTHWKLEWLTIGKEHDNRDDSVVMGGIGPDGARLMRGTPIMWPYLQDGSFCPLYQRQADILLNHSGHKLARFFIRQMCNEVVEKMLSGHGELNG